MPLNTAGGPCLTADIGGTNARLAVVGSLDQPPHHLRQYACRDFAGLDAVVDAYLADTGEALPRRACFAVAGPVSGNRARLTNGPWEIDGNAFCARRGLDACLVVNDFAGLAQGLPWLGADDLMPVGPQIETAEGTRLVTGPGTGLGVATLACAGGRRMVIAGEGGNASFAPQDDVDIELLKWFRGRMGGQVSAEALLSGRGLVDLHQALAEIEGRSPDGLTGPEITAQGLGDAAGTARKTLMRFLAILGAFAGDVALINGAQAGVYIGGGIVPRMAPLLKDSPFRARFEAKGRYQPYLAAIPTWLITASNPALTGAAACLMDPARRPG